MSGFLIDRFDKAAHCFGVWLLFIFSTPQHYSAMLSCCSHWVCMRQRYTQIYFKYCSLKQIAPSWKCTKFSTPLSSRHIRAKNDSLLFVLFSAKTSSPRLQYGINRMLYRPVLANLLCGRACNIYIYIYLSLNINIQ